MTNDKDDDGGNLRVRDLRRFDSEGNERDGDAASDKVTPDQSSSEVSQSSSKGRESDSEMISETSSSNQAQATKATYEEGASSGPQIDFRSFVISLATQALMQLGEIDPPPGMEMPKDKAAAKQTIDILIMLHEKTKGNLEADEDKLLEEILHNLRLSFVRAV